MLYKCAVEAVELYSSWFWRYLTLKLIWPRHILAFMPKVAIYINKIEVFRDLDLQSWRGVCQNEVYVAKLHCSLGRLVSALENSVE